MRASKSGRIAPARMCWDGEVGVSFRMAVVTPDRVRPSNGRWPVSARYRQTPKE